MRSPKKKIIAEDCKIFTSLYRRKKMFNLIKWWLKAPNIFFCSDQKDFDMYIYIFFFFPRNASFYFIFDYKPHVPFPLKTYLHVFFSF